MNNPLRVVFDCNVYFQATISEFGPANRCVRRVVERKVKLYASPYVIGEYQSICSRRELRDRFSISAESVEAMITLIREFSTVVVEVPSRYQLRADPKDSHYVDLALAADARLIVSRDRDLLRLREPTNPDGEEFLRLYPALEIMQPPDLLRLLAERPQTRTQHDCRGTLDDMGARAHARAD